jgi:Fe2+ or Zn2+ uptake regulation protein
MDDQIKCPKCGTDIKISQALSKQARQEIEKKHQLQLKGLELKIKKQEEEFDKKEKQLAEKQKKLLEEKELEIK